MGLLFISFFFACMIVFPIFLISSLITGTKKNQEKYKEKSIVKGHVVTAYLKKRSTYIRNVPGTHENVTRLAIYEYSYKGKQYKYRLWICEPPETITLYFDKNPRKATLEGVLDYSKVKWPWVYAGVTAVIYILVRIVLAL